MLTITRTTKSAPPDEWFFMHLMEAWLIKFETVLGHFKLHLFVYNVRQRIMCHKIDELLSCVVVGKMF